MPGAPGGTAAAAPRADDAGAPTATTRVRQVHALARRPEVPRPDFSSRRTLRDRSASGPELAQLYRRREPLPQQAVRKRRQQPLLEALGKVTRSTSRLAAGRATARAG